MYNQVNVNGKEITPPKVSNARTPFSGIFFLINVLKLSISSSVSITFLEVTQQETIDFLIKNSTALYYAFMIVSIPKA